MSLEKERAGGDIAVLHGQHGVLFCFASYLNLLCKRICVDSVASLLPLSVLEFPVGLKGIRQVQSVRSPSQLKECPVTVYFCRSRVISKQQANYSGCVPRKKALLTALPTVCWLLITTSQETGVLLG